MSARLNIYSEAVRNCGELKTRIPSAPESKPELLPLIELQKRRLAEAKVPHGTFSPSITGKLLAKNALDALQEVLGTAASAWVVGYASSTLSNEERSTKGHIAQAAATSLTVAATSLVRETMSTLINKSRLTERDAEIATYNNIKTKTTPEFLRSYPQDIQAAVKALDDEVENEIKSNSGVGATWFQQKIRHRELVLLARPSKTKAYTNFADREITRKFYTDLKMLVKDYPSMNSSTIETLVQRIAANSQSDRPVRAQAYLFGPGGVGKTRLVNLIAKTLNAPLAEINVPGKDLQSLMGYPYPAVYAAPTEPDNKVIGELQMKMIKTGYTNPIVFIDELRLTPNNLNDLKLLLDTSKKSLKLGGYDADLDWSRATIIIGSNDPLTDEAMQTRLAQIVIREVSDTAKIQVATTTIKAAAKVYQQSLETDEYKRLLSTCKTRINQVVEIDNENFPGVRFLESSTENMVHYVAAGILQGEPKTMDEIREHLEFVYAQAKGRAMPGDVIPNQQPLGRSLDEE